MLSDEEHTLVGRYLRGDLSDSEEADLKERVQRSPELQAHLSDLAVLEAYRSRGTQETRQVPATGFRPWHFFAGLSLVFLVGAVSSLLSSAPETPPAPERLAIGTTWGARDEAPSAPSGTALWLSAESTDSEPSLAELVESARRNEAHRVSLQQAEEESALALWNLAVVQEALGLHAVAASSFRKAASLESNAELALAAEHRAKWLEERLEKTRLDFRRANKAGPELIKNQTPFPPELASEFPGLMRLYLYDAIRSARSEYELDLLRQTIALLPPEDAVVMARELAATKRLLEDPAYKVLATRYRDSFESSLSRTELYELSQDAQAFGASSMALGALVRSRKVVVPSQAIHAYAASQDDAWLQALATRIELKRAFLDDELEGRWEEFFSSVSRAKPAFRKADIGIWLAYYAVKLRRLDLARRLIKDISESSSELPWSRARFLFQLQAKISLAEGRLRAASDFATEAISRADSCSTRASALDVLAKAAALRGELETTFAIAANEEGCSPPPSLDLLAHLRRLAPTPPSEELKAWWLKAIETRLESSGLSQSDRAAFELERALFEFKSGTVDAGVPLSLLHEAPRSDAQWLRSAKLETAQALLAASLRSQNPKEGALHASQALEIQLGTCLVFSDPSLPELVVVSRPSEARSARSWEEAARDLGSCNQVHVVSTSDRLRLPPPSFGIPWSVLTLRGHPATHEASQGTRLAVVTPSPPLNAGLRALPPMQFPADPRTVVLSGVTATPDSVLDLMQHAKSIEIVAHGVDDGSGTERTSIALAPNAQGDYRLDAAEVLDQRLRSDASVFLSVCQSAQQGTAGVPRATLPQAFAWAGALYVVAALAPIPAMEGAELFRMVAKEQEAGVPPSVALHRIKTSQEGNEASWLESVVVFSTQKGS